MRVSTSPHAADWLISSLNLFKSESGRTMTARLNLPLLWERFGLFLFLVFPFLFLWIPFYVFVFFFLSVLIIRQDSGLCYHGFRYLFQQGLLVTFGSRTHLHFNVASFIIFSFTVLNSYILKENLGQCFWEISWLCCLVPHGRASLKSSSGSSSNLLVPPKPNLFQGPGHITTIWPDIMSPSEKSMEHKNPHHAHSSIPWLLGSTQYRASSALLCPGLTSQEPWPFLLSKGGSVRMTFLAEGNYLQNGPKEPAKHMGS